MGFKSVKKEVSKVFKGNFKVISAQIQGVNKCPSSKFQGCGIKF